MTAIDDGGAAVHWNARTKVRLTGYRSSGRFSK